RGLAVLVVATPCPLILAAPVAFIGGVSRAARAGILMKGSAALEALAQIRTAIFDKTGTLTLGGAELIEIDVAPGQQTDEVLRRLASLEQASHHVLADSIVRIAHHRKLTLSQPCDVREHRGEGLKGLVDG
ncbi:MAG: heavy metal translocating P-type ATPase, partial [Mesorhizobium sp.]